MSAPPRELLARTLRRPGARAGLAALALLALAAAVLPPFLPDPVHQYDILEARLLPPGAEFPVGERHPLGTDHLSRDVLARLVAAAGVSLRIAALSVALSVTLGALVGLLAGQLGGWVDAVLMRLVDGALAIPRLFILLLLLLVWERIPLGALILVLGTTGWFATSRLVRGEVLRLRQEAYIQAAAALGAGHRRIIFRHLLPNVAGPLLVAATLGVGDVILLEAGLSFLGLGVPLPTPSWGGMILDSKAYILTAPWTSVAPGLAVAGTVLSVNLVGEALREALDPEPA
ncbi:MAG TPA: ABC transporter permease [Gemmatimonadales bacterium]|nr:ABC transporter permease [Gemmatimonadales bacterium]